MNQFRREVEVNTDEESALASSLFHAEYRRLKDLDKEVLNEEVQKALGHYTSNSKDALGNFYHLEINKKIEASLLGKLKLSPEAQGFGREAYLIDTFLKQASFATDAAHVYKGISREREYRLLEGKEKNDRVEFRNFVSTSYSRYSALTHVEPWFGDNDTEPTRILLRIRNAYGSPVENFDEIEFLIGADSVFEIYNISYETWYGPECPDVDLKVITMGQIQ